MQTYSAVICPPPYVSNSSMVQLILTSSSAPEDYDKFQLTFQGT